METTTPGTGGSLQLLLLLAVLIPAIFFLLTQQNTLKVIQPANRLMKPGLVWLQFIPIFGQFWQFFVVSRIAGSIRKELEFREEDTFLGVFDADAASQVGKKPTLIIGITYCVLNIAGILTNMFLRPGPGSPLFFFAMLLFLSSSVCWIVYWVQLAAEKRIMAELKPSVA
jgi:hypothetical protein